MIHKLITKSHAGAIKVRPHKTLENKIIFLDVFVVQIQVTVAESEVASR